MMNLKIENDDLPKLKNNHLPPKAYYSLDEASEILGCKTGDLVHYGATARLELVTPTPAGLGAIARNRATKEFDIAFDAPCLLILTVDAIREIDLVGSVSVGAFRAGYEMHRHIPSRCNPFTGIAGNDPDYKKADWQYVLVKDWNEETPTYITVTTSQLMVVAYELHRFKTGTAVDQDQQAAIDAESIREVPINSCKSNKLASLNQASVKFWSNADQKDRTTHPNNADVEKWLIEHGYSATLADKAASIIRPEWAKTGRKPDN